MKVPFTGVCEEDILAVLLPTFEVLLCVRLGIRFLSLDIEAYPVRDLPRSTR